MLSRTHIVLSGLALGAVASASNAAVVFSGNGKMMFAGVEAEYVGATVADVSGPVIGFENLQNPWEAMVGTAAASVTRYTPASTSNPDSDYISGSASLTYAYGAALAADDLTFEVQAGLHLGAQSALNSAGQDASARFTARAQALFFVDDGFGPVPLPYGTVIGALDFGAIGGVGPFAQLSVTVRVNDSEILSFRSDSGFAGASIDIVTGNLYEIGFSYEMLVPHGTVASVGMLPPPAFSYGVALVPGPSGLALIGAAGIAARRRRR
jgi:hypothetical protein